MALQPSAKASVLVPPIYYLETRSWTEPVEYRVSRKSSRKCYINEVKILAWKKLRSFFQKDFFRSSRRFLSKFKKIEKISFEVKEDFFLSRRFPLRRFFFLAEDFFSEDFLQEDFFWKDFFREDFFREDFFQEDFFREDFFQEDFFQEDLKFDSVHKD